MKIRIKGDAVRFRLTKSEVKALCETGTIKEQTHFGNVTFGYAVRMDSNKAVMHAEFKDNNITLFLPKTLGKDWFESDRVGFEHDQKNPNRDPISSLGKGFHLLGQHLGRPIG